MIEVETTAKTHLFGSLFRKEHAFDMADEFIYYILKLVTRQDLCLVFDRARCSGHGMNIIQFPWCL